MRKERFIRRFRERFLLRFHMSLILAATCLSGVLFSKLLLLLSVRDALIRYPLTACLSYLLFFLFVKLWLWYVSTTTRQKAADTADAVIETAADIPADLPLPGRAAAQAAEAFAGGGGEFGGAGASGSFGEAGEAGKSVGGKVGDLLPDVDENVGLALLALGVLLAVVFGAGLYLIYSAPAILSEAAFEFLLAGSLLRRSKRMDDPDWVGSVLRATWVPFVVVLASSVAAGWVLHAYFPEVARISDLFRR